MAIAANSSPIDIPALIDRSRIGGFQIVMLMLMQETSQRKAANAVIAH